MPPDDRGRPLDTHQGSGPNVDAHASEHDNLIVADGGRRRRGRCAPVASASLYEPAGRRAWWWISLRCPHCGGVHLHRVREEDQAAGLRRAGCGKVVWVVIRSVYRVRADRGAAA